MNLSAVLVIVFLRVIVMAAGRESASVGKYGVEHLSGNYKGICFKWIDDNACDKICLDESSDNFNGFCSNFQCWCLGTCTSETESAEPVASAPVRQ
ncbi:hypothetical protein BDA96_10G294700 [Sorghum bicolor]|uniref:Knottin scorpion toxin-like domain-containing protein n=1 Tax=Sorghum bicolor TaxID=4558 RepID=A0A921Q632_SORBI|nr:hypothetical protein BDA96_10G294700 [Sorghum bicolor]